MSLADEILQFGEMHKVGEGDLVGQPFEWQDFQIAFIRDVFDKDARRAILSVGRRNGKTATIAMLVLAATYGPLAIPNSQIFSASRSREQAAIVFHYAVKMASLSGYLRLLKVRDSKKEMFCRQTGITYRALSADATRTVGFGARLVVHDELGQVQGPRDALFDVLSTSMGSYDGSIELIISTQAATDQDLLSLLIDDAMSGEDPRSICHLHCADQDAGLDDRDQWLKANPATGHHRSLEDIRIQSEEAKRLPSREAAFRNLILNQRISRDNPFLSRSAWEACASPVDESVFHTCEVYGGLDLSSRLDLTAFVLVAEDSDGQVHVETHVWTPADTLRERGIRDRAPYDLWVDRGFMEITPGSSIDYELIAERIAEICEPYGVAGIAFDRWRMNDLQKHLDAIGFNVPLEPFGQGFRDMSPAIEAVEHLVIARRLRHGGHPVLRYCTSNCVVTQDAAGNRKLDKAKSFGRIDATIALAMAIGQHAKGESAILSVDDILFA